jgi:hypothetical protein
MSRQKAINEKCRDCIYDPLAGGTWRQQVENCTIQTCSLWPYRPVTLATKARRAGEGSSPKDCANSPRNLDSAA